MDKLRNMITKLKQIEGTLIQAIEKAIRDNEEFILALNYEDQLYGKGIRNDSKKIVPSYAESTIKRKKRKNQPTGRVTLRDENIFHRSFYIYYGSDNFEIMTTDPIEPFLTYRYGEQILGLTDENLRYVIEKIIAPVIIEKLKEL